MHFDDDHHQEYIAILVHYLQEPDFQALVATPGHLNDLITLLLDFETRISPADIQAVFQELAISKTDDALASDETNVILLSQLINGTSGISSTDQFSATFDLNSPIVERLKPSLAYPYDETPSIVCACIILGNLAMSDATCISIVQDIKLHEPLIEILFFSKHSALLYAAVGFLRHLAFPEENRTILGDARLIEACHVFLTRGSQVPFANDPAVRGEIAALLGKLVTNNPKNIERVVMFRVGELRGEPGELPLQSITTGPTCLLDLVAQSLEPAKPLPSTSMKNLTIEAGRTIVSILRYLGRSDEDAGLDASAVRQRMFEVPDIAKPVARLVRQRFYADARSEGLLGLGFMAQSPEGAACVMKEIKEDDGLLGAIKDFAQDKDGGIEGQQQGRAAGRDYQNAIVLLQALRNNWVPTIAPHP